MDKEIEKQNLNLTFKNIREIGPTANNNRQQLKQDFFESSEVEMMIIDEELKISQEIKTEEKTSWLWNLINNKNNCRLESIIQRLKNNLYAQDTNKPNSQQNTHIKNTSKRETSCKFIRGGILQNRRVYKKYRILNNRAGVSNFLKKEEDLNIKLKTKMKLRLQKIMASNKDDISDSITGMLNLSIH